MYTNKYGEKIFVSMSEYNLLSTDTKTNSEITKIINPFDLNITFNNPYNIPEKNQCCFLEINTDFDCILVAFKTEYDPKGFLEYFEKDYDYINDSYPDLFSQGILNIDLINKDNQLVLMYGTSIIILDIDTFEVLKYTSSTSIKYYGIKLSYENDTYIIEDDEHNFIYFDKDLNEITKKEYTTNC